MSQYDNYATATLTLLRNRYEPNSKEYQELTEKIMLARFGNKHGRAALTELINSRVQLVDEDSVKHKQLPLFDTV